MRILGNAFSTAEQMASYLKSKNPNPKLTRKISLLDFCKLWISECAKEGVRGDVAFAQACVETGHFTYGGDVKYTQNNFGGIGATGGVPGCSFKSIEVGILAQAQRLKSYATKDDLNCPCVDPRRSAWFMNNRAGLAPNVEDLSGTWAVPGYSTKLYSSLKEANKVKDAYGWHIIEIVETILKMPISKKEATMKIAIDAGHGSQTAGKRTPDGYKEHWINVNTAYYCEAYLKAHGQDTVRIGWNDLNATDDVDVPLATRQSQIKAAKCDISVSCHANAFGNGASYNSASGVLTLIHSNAAYQKDSSALAKLVQAELVKGTKQVDRGVKPQLLAMCNCNAMGTKASILVETGFMTNKAEAELLMTETFCKEQGEDIARGVLSYISKCGGSTIPSTPISSVKVNVDMFTPTKGNPGDFIRVVNNIKKAMNLTFGLSLVLNGVADEILLINLGNVELTQNNPLSDMNYALQQLFVWWGYSLSLDGIFGPNTASTVGLFQSQVGIKQTQTTTKEFWRKIFGK